MKHQIENEYATYWVEDDILHFAYKDDVFIDQSVAIKVISDRLSLQKGKEYLVFCDARGIKSFDKAARDYFAIEGSVLVKATAILIDNPLNDVLLDFYIKTSKSPTCIRKFTEKSEALQFLNHMGST